MLDVVQQSIMRKFVKDTKAIPLKVRQCAWCRKYLNVDGKWVGAIAFPFEHVVSHGICDICRKAFFGDILNDPAI